MTVTSDKKKKNPLLSYIPILDWFPKYDKKLLRLDLIAGLSVWTLMGGPQAHLSNDRMCRFSL
jgi:hypothetical protein